MINMNKKINYYVTTRKNETMFFFRWTPAHPRALARCCSQFFISSLIVERSCSVLGGRRRLHSHIMCSAIWALAPHVHVGVGFRPQRCMYASKRPTPDLRRFRVNHSFRGRSEPNGVVVSGFNWNWLGRWLCTHSSFQDVLVDLSAAYDTAWQQVLALTLLRVIPDRQLVRFIITILSNRSFKLKTSSGQTSRLRLLKNGVPQGSTLSPLYSRCHIYSH